MAQEAKAQWGKHIEFVLTLVGFAVGLGNVWRFPYLCYKNGGGAFVIPYFVSLTFIGLPLFFMELSFGQFAGQGPITIWRVNPTFKGIGVAAVTVNYIIGLYYAVVIAYAVFFFFASMTSELPWSDCSREWATCACNRPSSNVPDPWNGTKLHCVLYNRMSTMVASWDIGIITTSNITAKIIDGFPDNTTDYFPNDPITTPSQEYYRSQVLQLTSGLDEAGGLNWRLMLCNLFVWSIVFLVLIRGVQSLGKVVYFAATFPYILLTVLLVRGLTLDGHKQGIEFYLKPNITKLQEAEVWSDAAVQIFYSLGTCQGGLIAMASYNKFKNNCLRDAFVVPLINCLTSFYAGFVIFSVLGFMANEKGVKVADVTDSGPGLVFVVYPEALSRMPLPPLWSILFFLMLCTLGFSSQPMNLQFKPGGPLAETLLVFAFSIVETVCTSIIDEFPKLNTKKRKIITRLCICLVGFLFGLPMVTNGGQYMLHIVDHYIGGLPLLVLGFVEVVVINWIYGYRNFAADIEMMLGRKPFIYFPICWLVISPLALLALIIFSFTGIEPLTLDAYVYPDWGNAIGWLIVATPIVCMPGFWMFYVCKHGGWKLLRKLSKPLSSWKPNDPDYHTGRYDPSRISGIDSVQTDFGDIPPSYHNVEIDGKTDLQLERTGKIGVDNPTFSQIEKF